MNFEVFRDPNGGRLKPWGVRIKITGVWFSARKCRYKTEGAAKARVRRFEKEFTILF